MPLLALDVTPEKTIQTFVAAVNARRSDAAQQVLGGKAFVLPKGVGLQTFRVATRRIRVQGDWATVEADIAYPGERSHETVELRRVGGDWKIVPVEPTVFNLDHPQPVAYLAAFVVNPRLYVPPRVAAKKTACLSNVKQLSLATIMYASDHDDVLPKTSAGWKAAIMPYAKNERIFHCPEDASGKVSYFLDPRVAGTSLNKVDSPAGTAMVVEGAAGRAVFRHAGVAALGYTDGHAKLVKADAVAKARTIKLR